VKRLREKTWKKRKNGKARRRGSVKEEVRRKGGKSPAEEKKDVPACQERYGLPEQDLRQQEHPKELLKTCSYQHHRPASSMIPRW
jgi:hypothetical protein